MATEPNRDEPEPSPDPPKQPQRWRPGLRTLIELIILIGVIAGFAHLRARSELPWPIVRSLQDGDEPARRQALEDLVRLGPDAREAVPALIERLHNDPSPRIRAGAAYVLRQIVIGSPSGRLDLFGSPSEQLFPYEAAEARYGVRSQQGSDTGEAPAAPERSRSLMRQVCESLVEAIENEADARVVETAINSFDQIAYKTLGYPEEQRADLETIQNAHIPRIKNSGLKFIYDYSFYTKHYDYNLYIRSYEDKHGPFGSEGDELTVEPWMTTCAHRIARLTRRDRTEVEMTAARWASMSLLARTLLSEEQRFAAMLDAFEDALSSDRPSLASILSQYLMSIEPWQDQDRLRTLLQTINRRIEASQQQPEKELPTIDLVVLALSVTLPGGVSSLDLLSETPSIRDELARWILTPESKLEIPSILPKQVTNLIESNMQKQSMLNETGAMGDPSHNLNINNPSDFRQFLFMEYFQPRPTTLLELIGDRIEPGQWNNAIVAISQPFIDARSPFDEAVRDPNVRPQIDPEQCAKVLESLAVELDSALEALEDESGAFDADTHQLLSIAAYFIRGLESGNPTASRIIESVAGWITDDPERIATISTESRVFAARWLGTVGDVAGPYRSLLRRIAQDDPEVDVRRAEQGALRALDGAQPSNPANPNSP